MAHIPEEGKKCLIYKDREFHGICKLWDHAQSSPGLCGAMTTEESWAPQRAVEEPCHRSEDVVPESRGSSKGERRGLDAKRAALAGVRVKGAGSSGG